MGKSWMARALQRSMSTVDILTSDNSLIEQYVKLYPNLNAVIGKDHYETEELYSEAHKRARMEDSIFNPLSYYYARERGLRSPELVIVDEAHLLIDMLTYISSYVIPLRKTKAPDNTKNERELIKWCYERYSRLKDAIETGRAPNSVYQEYEKIARLKHTLGEGTQKQLFSVSTVMAPYNSRMQKCLVLLPLRVPENLIAKVTEGQKALFMSGTLSKYDAQHLAAGRSLEYIQQPYLAPPDQRVVYYTPVPHEKRKDIFLLADKIKSIYSGNKVPTLVHCTYAQQSLFAEALMDLNPLTNNTKNKQATKERFMKNGGIWLAAGCAEGLDLPYEACQQMIIPTLLFPDKGDAFVQKRVGLEDGQFWYKLRTYQNTVQRLGRGVRAADDKCVSYILDPAFSSVHQTCHDQLAPLNIIWGSHGNKG
jgi:Rad3-related DNA helicase